MVCSSAILPTIARQVDRINKYADEHGLNDHSPCNRNPIELTRAEQKREIRNCILAIVGIPLAALAAAFIAVLLA